MFRKPSPSKWGQVDDLSCENEFYLHENEKSFSVSRAKHLTSFWYGDPGEVCMLFCGEEGLGRRGGCWNVKVNNAYLFSFQKVNLLIDVSRDNELSLDHSLLRGKNFLKRGSQVQVSSSMFSIPSPSQVEFWLFKDLDMWQEFIPGWNGASFFTENFLGQLNMHVYSRDPSINCRSWTTLKNAKQLP